MAEVVCIAGMSGDSVYKAVVRTVFYKSLRSPYKSRSAARRCISGGAVDILNSVVSDDGAYHVVARRETGRFTPQSRYRICPDPCKARVEPYGTEHCLEQRGTAFTVAEALAHYLGWQVGAVAVFAMLDCDIADGVVDIVCYGGDTGTVGSAVGCDFACLGDYGFCTGAIVR